MLITHKFSLDLLVPQTPERIQVKQGDAFSHHLEIQLFSNGEAWPIPGEVIPVVRWCASDPGTGEAAGGIYDTLPNGQHAWNYAENQLDLILAPQMFALPGLVRADVALVQDHRVLGTANFEFYVNQAPATGTEPQAQDYYQVANLEQINAQFIHLKTLIQELREDMEEALADLESR